MPVRGQLMYQPVGRGSFCNGKIASDLSPEVVGVGAYSVHAVIRGRNDYGQHFAAAPAQGRRAVHDGPVKIQ